MPIVFPGVLTGCGPRYMAVGLPHYKVFKFFLNKSSNLSKTRYILHITIPLPQIFKIFPLLGPPLVFAINVGAHLIDCEDQQIMGPKEK